MRIVVATEDKPYFWWQMVVQISNFKKFDLDKNLLYVVGSKSGKISNKLSTIKNYFGVDIRVYKDTREKSGYLSSIRPHIMSKLLEDDPSLDQYVYLDTDTILNKTLRFGNLSKSGVWYGANVNSYIGSKYIKSKSSKLFYEMCNIVRINPKPIYKAEENKGVIGAQTILSGLDTHDWKKIENDCERLYKHMKSTEKIYNPQHPIQSWTADMWALFWNGLLKGNETKVIKRMSFVFATDKIGGIKNTQFMHNAGVTGKHKKLFNKLKYLNKSPFKDDLSFVSDQYCSYKYVQEIEDAKKNYTKLIKVI